MKQYIIFSLVFIITATSVSYGNNKFVPKDSMFKDPKQTEAPSEVSLDEMLEYYDMLKKAGSWRPDGSTFNVSKDQNTGGGNIGDTNLGDITKPNIDTSKMCPKFKEKNGPYAEAAFARENYQKALKNPLLLMDVTVSAKPLMSQEKWLASLPNSATPGFRELVKAVFVYTEKKAKEGKPVNPDFLIALSAQETGWGNNRLSKEKNSYFSMNAINSNPDAAYKYNTPGEAVVDVIDWVHRNMTPNGRFYSPLYGSSIIAANTFYAGDYWPGSNPKYWVSSETWAYKIGVIMEQRFKSQGVEIKFN